MTVFTLALTRIILVELVVAIGPPNKKGARWA
jgi:hypothetical protein